MDDKLFWNRYEKESGSEPWSFDEIILKMLVHKLFMEAMSFRTDLMMKRPFIYQDIDGRNDSRRVS